MYYLHHYFNPDFSHMKLSPHEASDGSVDYRYLGYVQNVVSGQVLAEVIDIEKYPKIKRDARFIYNEPFLPVGPNTAPHPKNPNKLLATENGYCFYYNGVICVKKVLNIRGNLGFHTGNVFFVGDLAVHGDVQTGFAVQANNIFIKQHIESAKVKATGDIVCLSGVKGGGFIEGDNEECTIPVDGSDPVGRVLLPNTLVDAGGSIRLPFCEHVQLRARGDIIIEGSCLHSTIYAGGNVIIKDRLQGGAIFANKLVYVGKQLGYDSGTPTRIMMGYSPFDFLIVQKIESQIHYLGSKISYFETQSARSEVMAEEFKPRLEVANTKMGILRKRREHLWEKLNEEEQQTAKECRIVVPGQVTAGCELGIGQAFFQTTKLSEDVMFRLYKDEIISTSPAINTKQHAEDSHHA